MARDDFYLTDEQRMIRDLARKVARDRVAPHAPHVDETETYPEASIQALVDAGMKVATDAVQVFGGDGW
jgi:alkylation response protein AidB-like acyl-CoA dehydrogenase